MSSAPFPSPTAKWHSTTYPTLSPSRPELSAKDKTVLITGGGTGIGAETARYFAKAGASRIAILGRREQPLLDTKASIESECAGVDVFMASTDVTNKTQVDAAFGKFTAGNKNGTIDVVVSNAGIMGPYEPAKIVDGDEFVDGVQQNIKGALNIAQAFLRYAAPGAVAINVSSSAAHVNFVAKFTAYNVSKMAVFRLWDAVAFANPDVSIFHIQPGIVATDLNLQAGGVKAAGFEDHVSLPASFSVWLASPEAQFLKGKFLWANWDVDELMARAEEIQKGSELSLGIIGWPFQSEEFKSDWNI